MNRQQKNFDEMKGTLRKVGSVIEVVLLAAIYLLVWREFYRAGYSPGYYGKGKYVLGGVYGFLSLILLYLCEGLRFGDISITDTVIAQWISMFIVNFITYFQLCLIAVKMISVWPMALLLVVQMAFCLLFCYFYAWVYHRFHTPRNMVMIYGTDKAVNLKFKMDKRRDKYRISTIISYEKGFEAICREVDRHDAVIINDVPAQIRNDILKYCYMNNVRTYVVPKISDIITRGARDVKLFDTPLLLVRTSTISPMERFVKRACDILISGVALIITSPILLLIAFAIKVEDGGPVFYRQERVTKGGKKFNILKFRSMIVDAEKDGHSIPATGRDPRITRVGRIIRATRVDELPQLINILSGQMSVVGPRPERTEHVEKYTAEIPEFSYRLKVKGGLTGYAQIYGKYNTSAYDKLRLDLMYIENYSLLLDVKLLLMTIRILFKKESTEGFDAAEEMEKQQASLLLKINENEEA